MIIDGNGDSEYIVAPTAFFLPDAMFFMGLFGLDDGAQIKFLSESGQVKYLSDSPQVKHIEDDE